jgi:hypothetical protein
VRDYIEKFNLGGDAVLLDPFCGTGTTLVEAKKQGLAAVGVEAVPMSHFACSTKVEWSVDLDQLEAMQSRVLDVAQTLIARKRLQAFTSDQEKIVLKNSIFPQPLHKCLCLLEAIDREKTGKERNLLKLALAYTAVNDASNLKFGPEVGVRRKKRTDANVLEKWQEKLNSMQSDLAASQGVNPVSSICHHGDSRSIKSILQPESIDAIITSPPYPNEKDYTRTTRLESVLLGFLANRADLRTFKDSLVRSNTRNVFKGDEDDLILDPKGKISIIAKEIERRRIALNKTSGFEKQYHRVTSLYFGGMKRHLLELQNILRPGAKLAYVVGDQASFLQVLIRTGELLADIAHDVGYVVSEIDLFRTRISTATGAQLREEVVILEWPGHAKQVQYFTSSNKMEKKSNRYDKLIENVFFYNFEHGSDEVRFDREDFERAAQALTIKLPKNLGDIIYSYRYRNELPSTITDLLDEGQEWIIRAEGKGKYVFAKSSIHRIEPNPRLSKIKIPDATPEIIKRYALSDEQALLAILRYNRLVDIFSGVAAYPLQSHLRTTVKGIGQVETDEIYVGVGKRGEQYIFPVQAKGKTDQLGIVQIEQDFAVCIDKFPNLICRPIAAQFIEENLIALFEFEKNGKEITIRDEKHYRIVPNSDLSDSEISQYREKG